MNLTRKLYQPELLLVVLRSFLLVERPMSHVKLAYPSVANVMWVGRFTDFDLLFALWAYHVRSPL